MIIVNRLTHVLENLPYHTHLNEERPGPFNLVFEDYPNATMNSYERDPYYRNVQQRT